MTNPSIAASTAASAATFNFLARHAPGQPSAGQAYEEHIESWFENAPPGENRLQLKNQILDAFRKGADLDLRGQTDIVSLPAGLWVVGNLDLRGCTNLGALPEGLRVGGDARFSGCTAITALPEALHIDGDVALLNCTNLVALPQAFHFGGSVILQGCSALRELPAKWIVNGDLNISFCTELSILMVDWNIRGSLSAHNCNNLTEMVGSLRVDGSLSFAKCSELVVFPRIFEVDKWINLSFCEKMRSLHPSITAPRENRVPRIVFLGGSGLSLDTLQGLRYISIPNVRFDTSIRMEPVESSGRTGTEATVQSSHQMRDAILSTRLLDPPMSRFERAQVYGSPHLLELAIAEALNAVSRSFRSPSEPMPPYENLLLTMAITESLNAMSSSGRPPSKPMPRYEGLCSISIDALEKQDVDTKAPCPIMLATAEQPVFVEPAIYEFAAIRTHYERGGKNPLTRLPINPNEVKRVVKQDSLSTQSTGQTEPSPNT